MSIYVKSSCLRCQPKFTHSELWLLPFLPNEPQCPSFSHTSSKLICSEPTTITSPISSSDNSLIDSVLSSVCLHEQLFCSMLTCKSLLLLHYVAHTSNAFAYIRLQHVTRTSSQWLCTSCLWPDCLEALQQFLLIFPSKEQAVSGSQTLNPSCCLRHYICLRPKPPF